MKGYKLFRERNGVLYPLFVDATEAIPIGVWLKAKAGELAEDGKHVKSKLGNLAYRPGWHLNDDAPHVEHIYSRGKDGKKYMKKGTVWAEVEYRGKNLQKLADSMGKQPRDKCLRYVPDGYYRYKTTAQMRGSWVICGEMRVTRILSDEEVERLCKKVGLEPLARLA